jgi:hypothetical protein
MESLSAYSANVVLTLIVGGLSFALSHVGPNVIVVRDDCDSIPPGNARLIIRIDRLKKSRDIFLPFGVPGPNQLVKYF